MKKSIQFFAFVFFVTIQAVSQNLVPNASFEVFTNCPTGNSQFPNNVPPWVNPVGSGTTPDYFNACATPGVNCNDVNVPNNFAGSIPAFDGVAYPGIIGYYTSCPNCREYIQVQLNSPLVAGTNYTLSMRVRLGSQSNYYCTGFGMYVSTLAPTQPGNQPISTVTPQLEDAVGINDTSAWTLMSTNYSATGGEEFITIGVFKDNSQITITNIGTSTGSCALVTAGAFYLIDSVNVVPALPNVIYSDLCFGDSTLFSVNQVPDLIATSWNFGDTASGINNDAFAYNVSHFFTAPGNYTVTTINYFITGSTDTILTNITIGSIPITNLGNDTTICVGSSLLLDAGSGYTSYQWSTGDTQSTYSLTNSGTYIVTVSDNGCANSDTINVLVINCTPIINLSSTDTSFCEKQCIDFFDLSTNSPTSWQWHFTGAVPDTSTAQNPTGICYNTYGSFDVVLIACNGLNCDTLTLTNFINEYQNPVDSIWTSNDTLYSLPFPAYQWYEVTNGLIPGATNQYFVPTQSGSYYCVVNDTIGCIATSNTISLTAVQPVIINLPFAIFPNPNSGNFEIVFNQFYNSTLNDNGIRCCISDAIGKIVYESRISSNKLNLDLESGIYFFELNMTDKSFRQKFIVRKY